MIIVVSVIVGWAAPAIATPLELKRYNASPFTNSIAESSSFNRFPDASSSNIESPSSNNISSGSLAWSYTLNSLNGAETFNLTVYATSIITPAEVNRYTLSPIAKSVPNVIVPITTSLIVS